jgi:hypothetical protein
MTELLEDFDKQWSKFEQVRSIYLPQSYVFELMVIESDARRYVVEAIKAENELAELEKKESSKGKVSFNSNPLFGELREILT